MAKISFRGLEDIDSMIAMEGRRMQRNALRALKAGAEVAASEFEKRIPVGPHSEHLKDSIAITEGKYTRMDGYRVFVGPEGYRGKDGEPFPKIGYILEYGSSELKPKPWMRPSMNAKQKDIVEAIKKELYKD